MLEAIIVGVTKLVAEENRDTSDQVPAVSARRFPTKSPKQNIASHIRSTGKNKTIMLAW